MPIPFKPVETGCDPEPADARRLWRAARPPIPPDDVCLHAFPLPAAPALAAAAAGRRLDLGAMVERAQALAGRGDFLVVEGAGGLLVPYADGQTTADLAARLGLPLLVVGRMALGTINHVALTLAEAARRALPVAGCILSRTEPEIGAHEAGNVELIAALTGRRAAGRRPAPGTPTRATMTTGWPTPSATASATACACCSARGRRRRRWRPSSGRSPRDGRSLRPRTRW